MLRQVLPFLLLAAASAQATAEITLTHGPLLGHVDEHHAHLWARAAVPGKFTMRLIANGEPAREAVAVADEAHDLTMHFAFDQLSVRTTYDVVMAHGEQLLVPAGRVFVTTAPSPIARTARVAMGSCANEVRIPEQPIWPRIQARNPDALLLLGDTPYIDDGTLAGRRRRHREFLNFAPVREVLREVATWTTWDDHDYATNDAFGAVKGSEDARAVFVDYHAHAGYGDGERGIYTSFRRGPIEVFVLDTRSFADSEPSPLAVGQRSLLGAQQLAWLQRGLIASTATFKVLACGMVWNGGVREGKLDCWGNWLAERDALWAWLGEQHLRGVVLVSGDVHRSRVILHPTKQLLGYDLPEFITSPLAQSVLDSNKVDVPGLVFDAGEPSSCLFLTAELETANGGTLTATFEAGDGRVFHERALTLAELSRPDAAVHYRAAVAELRQLFGEDLQHSVVGDIGRERMLAEPELATASDVRAEVAAAAGALASLDRASFDERCTFWATSPQTMVDEFGDGLLMPLVGLCDLEVAHGLQCLADGDVAELGRVVRLLLSTTRHLRQYRTTLSWALAASLESAAADLARRVPLQHEARPMVLAELRRHLDRRAAAAELAVANQGETMALLDQALLVWQGSDQRGSALSRRQLPQVRLAALAMMAPSWAAESALAAEQTEQNWQALKLAEQAFADQVRERRRELLGGKSPEAAEGLAWMLMSMIATTGSRGYEVFFDAERALREALQ